MLTSTSAALKEKDEKIEMLEVTIHNWAVSFLFSSMITAEHTDK